MIGAYDLNQINNVAARVVHTNAVNVAYYHPDCLANTATNLRGSVRAINDDDVLIDHEYCSGEVRFTRYDDICSGCLEMLGESGGIQPEDKD